MNVDALVGEVEMGNLEGVQVLNELVVVTNGLTVSTSTEHHSQRADAPRGA